MKEKEPKQPKEKKVKEPKEKKVKVPKEKPVKTPKLKQSKTIKNREKWTAKYFKKFAGRSQDSYDLMLNEDYENAVNRAHQLLNITPADYDQPILITVPDAYGPKDSVTYRLDRRPDGKHTLLYDQALVTVLFFGADSFYYYQVNIDHRNGHLAYDHCGEFNYFDVVHLETQIAYDHVEHPKFITLDININLANGTKVPLHLRNHRIHDNYELESLLTESESKIIQLLTTKIRESRSV